MPISKNACTNLSIHSAGCFITSLDLLQHHICKGQLNVSKSSTVVRLWQTAPDSLQQMVKMDWQRSSKSAGSWLCRVICFGSTREYSEYKDKSLIRYIPWIAAGPRTQSNGLLSHLKVCIQHFSVPYTRSSLFPPIPRSTTLFKKRKKERKIFTWHFLLKRSVNKAKHFHLQGVLVLSFTLKQSLVPAGYFLQLTLF